MWAIGGLKHAKRVNKYKIANFEANFQFETLLIHKWTQKMVVQTLQYLKDTFKGIGGP